MVKFGILLPEEGMIFQAREEMKEMGEQIAFASVTTNHDVVRKAIDAINQGADILIARGYQAVILKERFDLPIINVRFTISEIGLLLKKGKKLCYNKNPYIIVAAFENMLPNMNRMSELFDIEIEVIQLDQITDIRKMLIAKGRKPDLIIGGKEVNEIATEMKIQTMYYQCTGESVHEAIKEATRAANGIRVQRERDAWISALIDDSFSGIILIDRYGKINKVNHIVENTFNLKLNEIKDSYVSDVLPELANDQILKVLSGKNNAVAMNLRIGENLARICTTAVSGENGIFGAVIILEQENKLPPLSIGEKAEGTSTTLLDKQFPDLKKQVQQARIFAMSHLPVLISTSSEDEGVLLARFIHENSKLDQDTFIEVDISAISPERQKEILFRKLLPELNVEGERTGLAIRANHGTLLLRHVEKLTPVMQSWFYHAATPYKKSMHSDTLFDMLDFRLIATTSQDLDKLVQNGHFDSRLCLLLKGLSIQIPSLKERPNDVRELFLRFFNDNMKRYGRHLRLTQGAIDILPKLSWTNGMSQVRIFTERVVLSAVKRNIDEVFLKQQFNEIFPKPNFSNEHQKVVIYHSEESDTIRKALEESHGNRTQASLKLGISISTLWRKMKKYGIDASYEREKP